MKSGKTDWVVHLCSNSLHLKLSLNRYWCWSKNIWIILVKKTTCRRHRVTPRKNWSWSYSDQWPKTRKWQGQKTRTRTRTRTRQKTRISDPWHPTSSFHDSPIVTLYEDNIRGITFLSKIVYIIFFDVASEPVHTYARIYCDAVYCIDWVKGQNHIPNPFYPLGVFQNDSVVFIIF
jgi:hypothetical protein